MSNEPLTSQIEESIIIKYEKDDYQRGSWANKFEFILSCIGTAVGLGNVWRFPYLCFQNGGGSFLIPYFIALVFLGLPLFFMELALGQFAGLGTIGIWNVSPLFKGVGYGMVLLSGIVCIYYNVIISHCLYYFAVSFTSVLPWKSCNNSWNNRSVCYDGLNGSDFIENSVYPSEEYYYNYVLNKSNSIYDIGPPQWRLVICLAIAWIIVAVILIKGIQIMGKVSYFTAIFPYIILTILLIRGALLPGALNGMLYYLYPDWNQLLRAEVWVQAATQIFFSFSVCNGNLITMSSYNKFTHNCHRDAIIVAILNGFTSIYAGFVIFANMGFMAHVKNVSIDSVVKSGPGLAFVIYPEAMLLMPLSPLWSILFFFMMITLGVGSEIALVQTVIAGIQDELAPYNFLKSNRNLTLYRVLMCAIGFLVGLPMVCRGGIYLITLCDSAISNFPMLFIACLENLVISYCYGIDRFLHDIELMIGSRPNIYWKVCWMAITPLGAFALIIFLAIQGSVTGLPPGIYALYVILQISPMCLMAIIFLYQYCKRGGFLLLRELRKPVIKWGPSVKEDYDKFYTSLSQISGTSKSSKKQDKSSETYFQSKESIAKRFQRNLSQSSSLNACDEKLITELSKEKVWNDAHFGKIFDALCRKEVMNDCRLRGSHVIEILPKNPNTN